MDELLETVVTVESYAVAAVGAVGVATLATAGLVFLLSIRLRRREIETLVKIGGSRASVATVLLSEVVGVTLLGVVLAGLLTLVTSRFGEAAIRRFLLS
jgi:putative ABC transport system permease protein